MHWRDEVRLRANGHCERCERSIANYPASIHHRRPRGMGGSIPDGIDSSENCVLLCGSGTTGCHGWVEHNRAVATDQGWLVPRRDPRDPADVPVYIGGVWYRVTPEAIEPADDAYDVLF